MGQLAKRHGHELRPTGEPFGGVFGVVLLDQTAEFRSREMLQKLIEQAGDLYHNDALLEASDRTDGYRFTHSLRLHRRAYRLQSRVKPNSLRPTVPSLGRISGD